MKIETNEEYRAGLREMRLLVLRTELVAPVWAQALHDALEEFARAAIAAGTYPLPDAVTGMPERKS